MSANNLGVCVGQSLLNDEHQTDGGCSFFNNNNNNNKSSNSTFTKRHRRAKSQSLLSSTLSLTSSTSLYQTNGIMSNMNASTCYLNSNSAQETAKYVPILVAFMIENAPAIFGKDIITIFSKNEVRIKQCQQEKKTDSETAIQRTLKDSTLSKPNYKTEHESASFDQIDHGSSNVLNDEGVVLPSSLSSDDETPVKKADSNNHNPMLRQIVVQQQQQQQNCGHLKSISSLSLSSYAPNGSVNMDDIFLIRAPDCNPAIQSKSINNDGLTSILIVNSPKRQEQHQHRHIRNSTPLTNETQRRPLSTTESTSSSRASSSTSGVHSESQAFSSEVDSTHNTRSTSLSPSSVSLPSSMSSSTSPVQEESLHGDYVTPNIFSRNQHNTHAKERNQQSSSINKTSNLNNDLPTAELPRRPRSLLVAPTSTPLSTLSMPRCANRQMINRYSTYVNVLNRVPKIPVHFAASNYGGETIIYNPNPHLYQNRIQQHQLGIYPSTIQTLQHTPRVNRFSLDQFNGLYVKNTNNNSGAQEDCNPLAYNYNSVVMRKQRLLQQHGKSIGQLKSSFPPSPSDHSSDESDGSIDDWGRETTMV